LGATAARSAEKLRSFEDLDVLGDGLERHVERRRQLCDGSFLACDSAQDFATCGMRERVKDVVEAARS
jgi:hypothetical protein